MKTLVTGATGFVGAALVRHLLEADTDVRILRRAHSQLDLLGDAAAEVEHAIGDVRDPESLQEALRDVEQVYHVAGAVGVLAQQRGAVARMRRVKRGGGPPTWSMPHLRPTSGEWCIPPALRPLGAWKAQPA